MFVGRCESPARGMVPRGSGVLVWRRSWACSGMGMLLGSRIATGRLFLPAFRSAPFPSCRALVAFGLGSGVVVV